MRSQKLPFVAIHNILERGSRLIPARVAVLAKTTCLKFHAVDDKTRSVSSLYTETF